MSTQAIEIHTKQIEQLKNCMAELQKWVEEPEKHSHAPVNIHEQIRIWMEKEKQVRRVLCA